MHDNEYYPERGTCRPEIPGLSDQWGSDLQDLSEDDLKYGREKLNWLYEEFKNEFGYDTLTANGNFETSRSGFSKLTKALSIGSLNTLGYSFSPSLIFKPEN